MQVNVDRDTKLQVEKEKVASDFLKVSKSASGALNRNLNSLNETDKEREEYQEGGIRSRLSPRELRKWDRQSKRKKEQYLKLDSRSQYLERESVTIGVSNTTKQVDSGIAREAEIGAQVGIKQTVSEASKTTLKEASKGTGVGIVVTSADLAKKGAIKFKEHLAGSEAEMKKPISSVAVTKPERMGSTENKDSRSAGVTTVAATLATGFATISSMILVPILIGIIVFVAVITAFIGTQVSGRSGAEEFVLVARQEYANASKNVGGKKYKDWYKVQADWCAIFISWCANECDYIEQEIFPKTAAVRSSRNWYEEKELYYSKGSGYKPKAGDLVYFENGMSHIGIVVAYDEDTDRIETIEGNSGPSTGRPYHTASQVTNNFYPSTTSSISGYASPEYPESASSIEVPEPYGTVYSYMGWQTITSPSSSQYKLREAAGMRFDQDGFGIIDGRYVIACTTKFGQVGDYIDWTLANGEVIKTVIGDIKNQRDLGCNEYGHKDGACVVEFVVDKNSWYGTSKHPTKFHPEWRSRVGRSDKVGSYW
ncbi:CHAP domain-containing protein [Ohessyouella blattaphilus]|uniref:CHAP domain-containing protein n=1 Tax=Ohessyouella blattaphilus TaxID=2949333 RepID=A0ABT1EHU0_9FIRM|nr:CHAP domain-containing protein [Ohessyouella blattaphilus]MCP1110260.1 CHAP domain-containing protein [Ohessyouella blattaphilus]MCR8563654.1 CHAP domain-containing protein [Ohessyouella blattaphilus]